MLFQDMLLHIDTYPDPMPEDAIDEAIGFARGVGGRLSGLAVEVSIPVKKNPLAFFIDLGGLARDEEQKSRAAMRSALTYFSERAEVAGVFSGAISARAGLYDAPHVVARHTVTRDLCLISLSGRFDGGVERAQTVIFRSGRPVIVYQPGEASLPSETLGLVMLAWDGSPVAAKAMREALPLLQRAPEVRLVTFVHEKEVAKPGLGRDAVRHLMAYHVQAVAEDVSAKGGRIGDCLDAYIAAQRPSLLVMGAYGHSRRRAFILGGATEYVLRHPKVATLLAR